MSASPGSDGDLEKKMVRAALEPTRMPTSHADPASPGGCESSETAASRVAGAIAAGTATPVGGRRVGTVEAALLRGAGLTPRHHGNATAAAHVAAMVFFDLAAAAHGEAAPSDVPVATLAPLALVGTAWLWGRGINLTECFPNYGDCAILLHDSCRMLVAIPLNGNGFFRAATESRGSVTVYSHPGGNSLPTASQRHREDTNIKWADVRHALAREFTPLDFGAELPDDFCIDLVWQDGDTPADPQVLPAYKGKKGSCLCVVKPRKSIGKTFPLQLFEDGAQRLIQGDEVKCFHMFLESEAPEEAAAE